MVCRKLRTYILCLTTQSVGKKYISHGMHRKILNPPGHLFVDHINRNGLDNQKANLRYFKEEKQAAKEYDKAAKKYHGQFASLNFPD